MRYLTDEVFAWLDNAGQAEEHFEGLARTWWVHPADQARYREKAKEIRALSHRYLNQESELVRQVENVVEMGERLRREHPDLAWDDQAEEFVLTTKRGAGQYGG